LFSIFVVLNISVGFVLPIVLGVVWKEMDTQKPWSRQTTGYFVILVTNLKMLLEEGGASKSITKNKLGLSCAKLRIIFTS
jgi:hypothetical protein